MCKYSLEHLQNRPARKNEHLRTDRFDSGVTNFKGADGEVVCVKDGTTMFVSGVPRQTRERHGVPAAGEATFVEAHGAAAFDHLKFGDILVSFQELEGIEAVILAIPDEHESAPATSRETVDA